MNHRFYFVLLTLFFILPLFSHCSDASKIDLKLYSTNQNYSTEYFFNIFIPSPILNQASIGIIFPFSIEDLSPCIAFVKPPNRPQAVYECEKLDFRLMIDMEELISGNYEILLENVHNPIMDDKLSVIVRTYENRTILIDEMEILEKVKYFPPVSSNS